jgi:alkylated DNA repair dioxygenase AlkB
MPEQLTLLVENSAQPQGLRYQPEFISSSEEQALVVHIRSLPLTPFQFGAFEGKRRVCSFGWRYNYSDQRLEQADPIPGWVGPVIARIESFAALGPGAVRQVLCTEYEVGAGIGWHRDKKHFDDVFGLSLASACRFRFRRKRGNAWQRFTLDAAPRSLYAMTGESRQVWEHSIPPVESKRYSFTFRTLTKASCVLL